MGAGGRDQYLFNMVFRDDPTSEVGGLAAAQRTALRETIEAAASEPLVVATPIDAARLLGLSIPCVRVRTVSRDLEVPGLADRVEALLARRSG